MSNGRRKTADIILGAGSVIRLRLLRAKGIIPRRLFGWPLGGWAAIFWRG